MRGQPQVVVRAIRASLASVIGGKQATVVNAFVVATPSSSVGLAPSSRRAPRLPPIVDNARLPPGGIMKRATSVVAIGALLLFAGCASQDPPKDDDYKPEPI